MMSEATLLMSAPEIAPPQGIEIGEGHGEGKGEHASPEVRALDGGSEAAQRVVAVHIDAVDESQENEAEDPQTHVAHARRGLGAAEGQAIEHLLHDRRSGIDRRLKNTELAPLVASKEAQRQRLGWRPWRAV